MIERLVKILRNAGLEDVTAVEIAEMILLADAFPISEPGAMGDGAADDGKPDEPTAPSSTPQPPSTGDRGMQPESATEQPPQATLIDQATQDAAEDDSEGEGVDLAPFRAPRANPLPGERKIARALRPLRRRHPSTRRFILDEEKTIRRIADGGPISLVLQPAPEAWLEVALVFDESVTMRVWRQTLERLQHLFESCGYFRDVRAWRLNTESDEAKLYRATAAGASRPLHRPGELLDPAGRRLIVVVSDCHAPAWHTGAAYAVIHDWALKGPVALLQALPEPFWAGTTMTPVDAALRVPKSAATNRLLQIAQAPYRHVIEAGGVALPVVTLDEWSIAPWARAVAGATGVSISGLVIPPPEAMALALAAQPKAEAGGSAELLTAVERVENFFNSSASKEAKQLARYLASAPLSLPVMQLVQQTMLPQARQSHLAEVFLSGLLYQSTSHRNPDEIIYEFYEGVRVELRRFVTESEIVRVIDEASRYIESRIGEPGDFEAGLAVPAAGGAVKRLDPLSLRFAVLSADILRRFGRYQESVLKLERLAGLTPPAKGNSTEKTKQADEDQSLLSERIFKGAMGELSASEVADLQLQLERLSAIEVLRLAKSESWEWRGDGFYDISSRITRRHDPKENDITALLKLATDRCRATFAPQVINLGAKDYSLNDVAIVQSDARLIAQRRPTDKPYVILSGQYRLNIAIEAANGLADEFPNGMLFAKLDDTADATERVLQSFIYPFIPLIETAPESLDKLERQYQTILAERRLIVLLDQARAERSEMNQFRLSRAGFEEAVKPLTPPSGNVMIALRSGVDLSKPSRESLELLLQGLRGAYAATVQRHQTTLEPKDAAELLQQRRDALVAIRKTEIELLEFDRPTIHRSIEILHARFNGEDAGHFGHAHAGIAHAFEALANADSPERRCQLLINLGNRYFKLERKEEAAEFYELGMRVVPEGLSLQIDLLTNLGNCSLPSTDYYEMALENAIVEERHLAQLPLLLMVGKLKAANTDHDTFPIYERAIALASQLGDRETQAEAVEALGEFYYKIRDVESARKELLDAGNIYSTVSRFNDQARMLSRVGDLYNDLQVYFSALDYYGQALSIWEKEGDGRAEFRAHTLEKICAPLDALERGDEASKAAEQARELFRTLNLETDVARLDEYLRKRGDSQQAFAIKAVFFTADGKMLKMVEANGNITVAIPFDKDLIIQALWEIPALEHKLTGSWSLRVYIEPLAGSGYERNIQIETVLLRNTDTPQVYTGETRIQASSIPIGNYKLSVVAIAIDNDGRPLPVGGYSGEIIACLYTPTSNDVDTPIEIPIRASLNDAMGLQMSVLSTNDAPTLHVEWETPQLEKELQGYWEVELFAESIGSADQELTLPKPLLVNVKRGLGSATYVEDIKIAVGSLKPGMYGLILKVINVTSEGIPTNIVAFKSLGLVQIYE